MSPFTTILMRLYVLLRHSAAWDPGGKIALKNFLPYHMNIMETKDKILPTTPVSEQNSKLPAMPQAVPLA